ncbi:TPA: macrophage lectin 2-like [Bos taurus]|nr:TPA: macrophage lectin 2-like [Bos taurus]
MSVKYEDLQYLESEKKSQRFTEGPSLRGSQYEENSRSIVGLTAYALRKSKSLPNSDERTLHIVMVLCLCVFVYTCPQAFLIRPPTSMSCTGLLPERSLWPHPRPPLFSSQTFLKRLLSSPCLLLLSLALSLLLASICVMGYQNFKFQSDLQTLRTSFSNFTSNSMAEVQALNSQARSLNDKVLSLENRLEKQLEELKAGDSEMLLRVQQLVKNLNSLTCKMDALKSNGSQNTACCPANWLEHEGHCYWFSSLRKPWPEAEKDCQLKNAQLVVINSRDEQDFIQANLHPYFTWMGLSDPDGVWKWVDGSDYETNIKNWKPGQPDDFHGHGLGGGEDCAHFYPDGEWNDDACQRLYYWICEAGLSQGN